MTGEKFVTLTLTDADGPVVAKLQVAELFCIGAVKVLAPLLAEKVAGKK